MEEKKVSLQISIIRISDQGFLVNENVSLQEKTGPGLDIRLQVDQNLKEKKFAFTVEAVIYVQSDPSQVLLSGKVRTDYQLDIINDTKSGDSNILDVPDQVMITMLSLAISHLRSILAKNASGTVHRNIILPIVNPAEVYHHFKTNPVANE